MLRYLFKLALFMHYLATTVVADGTFRSHPDLSPPYLGIAIKCSGTCEEGFIFIALFVAYADLFDYGPLQRDKSSAN